MDPKYIDIDNIEISDLDDIDISDLEDPDISDFEDTDDDIADNRPVKRYIRDGQNPFEFYEEDEFKKRFRFNKESVLHGILPKIIEPLTKTNNRGLPIPPQLQLLACLQYYATSSFQQLLGDSMQISQPTMSRIIFRVSCLIASLISDFIKMPGDVEARRENRRLFMDLGKGNGEIGLPDIDGAIDCTHVRLLSTRFNNIAEAFRNRKGYFSLNVQAAVGPRMEFLDIVPEYAGSSPDSRIFQNSLLCRRYMEGRLNGMLVGDRGYPCLPFLMTPLPNPQTDDELIYNNIQSRTRQIVERTFGVWKRRFPCLSRGLSTKLICSTTIVVACAVLHNMSLIFNDILPEDDDFNDDDDNDDDDSAEVPMPLAQHVRNLNGSAVREALIAQLFN